MMRSCTSLLLVLLVWVSACPDIRSQGVDDGEWLPTFGLPGVDGAVNAIAFDGDEMYAGGKFRVAGTVVANGVARWDGERWVPLGDGSAVGVDGTVNAIAVIGDKVYVGGSFLYAGGIEARNIAVWNRMTGEWSDLGGGVGGGVFPFVAALAVRGSDLYVGGRFGETGALLGFNIARWNGTEWGRLGVGVNGDVLALEVAGDRLYVGGRFATAGGSPASCVASYGFTDERWEPLGDGVSGGDSPQVSALDFFDGSLYAGGSFVTAGSVPTPNIARWESGAKTWNKLGSGLPRSILAVVADADSVIALGDVGAVLGDTGWVSYPPGNIRLSGGSPRVYTAVRSPGGDLFIGGEFTSVGREIYTPIGDVIPGVTAVNIACLKGASVTPRGSTIEGTVRALTFSGGSLYAVGPFVCAGSLVASGVARWDGEAGRWSVFGDQELFLATNVHVLSHGTYVLNGTSLMRWEPSRDSFATVVQHSSFDDRYAASCDDGNRIYIAQSDSLIRWDGTTATALGPVRLGSRSGYSPGALAMAVHGDDVFVGGFFDSIAGKSIRSLARWNVVTGTWASVGGDIEGQTYPKVFAVAVDSSGRVYAGGTFKSAGGTAVQNIAMYDPSSDTWSDMGGGANDSVLAILVQGNDVYVAGRFVSIGGVDASGVARWDGTSWHALGAGVELAAPDEWIFSMTASPDGDVFVGGHFLRAGLNASYNLAHWSPAASSAVPDHFVGLAPSSPSIPIHVYPNPISNETALDYELPCSGETSIDVFTESGRHCVGEASVDRPAGRHSSVLSFGELPSGVYYVRVECCGHVDVARVEVVR